MSSRSQRRFLAVWLMARGLGQQAAKSGHGTAVIDAVRVLEPYILPGSQCDRAAARAIVNVHEFLGSKTDGGALNPATEAAFFHAVAAAVSDILAECPDTPPARKAAWLHLNNAIVDLAGEVSLTGADGFGVEQGCQWAEAIEEILRRV